jgi:hypothetical protein
VVIHGGVGRFGCRRLAALIGKKVGALERPTSGHEDARAAGPQGAPSNAVVSEFPLLGQGFRGSGYPLRCPG